MQSTSLNIKLVKATESDDLFLLEAALSLSDKRILDELSFNEYFKKTLKEIKTDIWLIISNGQKAGYALLNRTPMLRFRGDCVEIEEIVIIESFRNKGLGSKFLQLLIAHYEKDTLIRKISIKTNDVEGSARLYDRVFEKTGMSYFQQYLNKV